MKIKKQVLSFVVAGCLMAPVAMAGQTGINTPLSSADAPQASMVQQNTTDSGLFKQLNTSGQDTVQVNWKCYIPGYVCR